MLRVRPGSGKTSDLTNLSQENLAQFGIRVDEKEMVRRRGLQPLFNSAAYGKGWHIQFANRAKKCSDVLVKNLLRSSGRIGVVFDINSTTVTVLCPTVLGEEPVAGADGVGMDAEASCQLTGAGKLISRTEISAEDCQADLRDELPIDGHFSVDGEPESHVGLEGLVS